MDDLKYHVQWVKTAVAHASRQLYTNLEQVISPQVQHSLKRYASDISATTAQELVRDVKELRWTAATGTLVITAATLVVLVMASLGGDTKQKKPKKKKKTKLTKAQRANREIQAILDYVEETYVPQIDAYIETYSTLTEQDKEYKFSYFQEMLLKELMKLDGVDVAGNDVLRENRRKVIRFVQEHQTRLDKFRKENL